MSANPADAAMAVLRTFSEPFPEAVQCDLNEGRDELLLRFTTKYNCNPSPAHWPLKQVDELNSIIAPMIGIHRINGDADKKFPELNQLISAIDNIKPGDRVQHTREKFRQCSKLCAEAKSLLQPVIDALDAQPARKHARQTAM